MAYVKRNQGGQIVTVFCSQQPEELEFVSDDSEELVIQAELKQPRKLPLQVIATALLELHQRSGGLSDETIEALRLLED